ncbi:zinc ribbon domain-containing protein [Candidatus Thorarchaeota archaeon]|nr:MAG: zinc ribbon domain-containing protein [Candidatus Thorarchaeota archaeon]
METILMQFFLPDMFILFIAVLVVLGVVIIYGARRLQSGMMGKARILNVVNTYQRISIRRLAELCGTTEQRAGDAIRWGMDHGMPFAIEGDEFVRLGNESLFQRGESRSVVYLVICPHCGHKNPQGITECENCGASL